MTAQVSSIRNRRVFESVFGSSNLSLPTPYATPATESVVPGQAWGGPVSSTLLNEKLRSPARGRQQPRFADTDSHVEDQVKWDRAWHLVTHTLSIPQFVGEGIEPEQLKPNSEQVDEKFRTALRQVLSPGTLLPRARQTEDVITWYTAQVRHDFLHQILPMISRFKGTYDGEELLGRSIKALETANKQYLHGLHFIIRSAEDLNLHVTKEEIQSNFRRDFYAIMEESVMNVLATTLTEVLNEKVELSLYFSQFSDPERIAGFPETLPQFKHCENLFAMIKSLHGVGLAGEKLQVILAEIMDKVMARWIYFTYKGAWDPPSMWEPLEGYSWVGYVPPTAEKLQRVFDKLPLSARHVSPSQCVVTLCLWIENYYSKLIASIFSTLGVEGFVKFEDLERYKEVAIDRLADLRIQELFDIVCHERPVESALEDLSTAINTPQKRLKLTETFARNLQRRLLHPGTSTLQILQTYISMIFKFHALDHSKVLLDRVAYPLQVYLFSRQDTVRIIIEGLLADAASLTARPLDYPPGHPIHNKLHQLSSILQDDTLQGDYDGEELDWHDLEWTPDPVDAGPGYKRSKRADVIGTMLSVLGTQDIFIKEFQRIIADLFLQKRETERYPFQRETRVLDLLKGRFGEAPLQACEVMLKDIQDSIVLTREIRATLHKQENSSFWKPTSTPASSLQDAALDTKILSRLFWPSAVVDEERFKVPSTVAASQKGYEAAYEEKKSRTKLTWLNALGQAEVELELQDRTVKFECETWMASVIYAFDGEDVTRTAEQLEEMLEMDEDLVASALHFWLSKRVLIEPTSGTYIVQENLSASQQRSNSIAAQGSNNISTSSTGPSPYVSTADDPVVVAPARSSKAKDQGILGPNSAMYWNFVKGMLTNSKKEMPVMQIGMTLKMAIPGGFPYGNEELGEWLAEKVGSGELEVVKGKFRLKR